jgi:hypothetical protein
VLGREPTCRREREPQTCGRGEEGAEVVEVGTSGWRLVECPETAYFISQKMVLLITTAVRTSNPTRII